MSTNATPDVPLRNARDTEQTTAAQSTEPDDEIFSVRYARGGLVNSSSQQEEDWVWHSEGMYVVPDSYFDVTFVKVGGYWTLSAVKM